MTLEVRIQKSFLPARDSSGFALDVNFSAEPGITVLFGASGAGKTLTLDCIAGFTRPDGGRILLGDSILFDGETRLNLRPQDRECGYVFQNYALFPHMSVRENLFFAAERKPRLERHRRVSEMIESFRLSDVAGRRPHEISGGERQRCSIARALITTPRVLLLDEPATGLDIALREDFHLLLRELRRDFRIPMVLVTHDLEEAIALGDKMLIYEGGRIVQAGSPQSVLSHPSNIGIARLVGYTNVLSVEVIALDPARNLSRLRLEGGELTGPYLPGHLIGDRAKLMVRADEVRVYSSPGPNRLKLRVEEYLERARNVELRFSGGMQALVGRSDFATLGGAGDLYLEIPAASLKLTGGR
jgi:molybdate transport system ATP-binding protein